MNKKIHNLLVDKGIPIEKNTVSTNLSKLCKKKHVFKYYDGKRNQAPKYIHKSKLTPEIEDKIVEIKTYKKRSRKKSKDRNI